MAVPPGDKKFLFGDDACAANCAVFNQLCQVMWHVPSVVTAKAAAVTFLIIFLSLISASDIATLFQHLDIKALKALKLFAVVVLD
ncbi:hypothetical protein DPMN_141426 [Dreissena polymorpha]|uniref:Uncharacterized protein n=1 Tax=Dreissena polymorpha TaxID=45954 RepID=A0A9D4GCM5_DREPO|nr:hypothetical protein DPMN_141426 [Dreissena polymorpha]